MLTISQQFSEKRKGIKSTGKIWKAAVLFQLLWNTLYLSIYLIGLMSRVFANGPWDQGSIPGRAIPKTKKMVLDA